MKLFQHKRGDITERIYFILFEIVLVVLVASIIFGKINDIRTNQLFQKKFLARDLALVVNVGFAAPGVLMYAYGKQSPFFKNFEVSVRDGLVMISGIPYPYAIDQRVLFSSEPVAGTKGISIVRSGNEYWAGFEKEINPLRLRCPTMSRIARVTLDAGHGWSKLLEDRGEPAGDKGIIAADSESEIMRRLAAGIYGHDPQFYAVTRDINQDGPLSLEERQKRIEVSLVSLHASTTPTVKAFVNAHGLRAESEQLACAIVNAITDTAPRAFTQAYIIPVDVSKLAPQDPKRVLIADKPGVLIEIGNLNDATYPLLKNTGKLSDAIHTALLQSKVTK